MAIGYNPSIVMNGLVLCIDPANVKSYPKTGNTCIDVSNNGNNGNMINVAGYNTANSGSFIFNGANSYIDCGSSSNLNTGNNISTIVWFNSNSNAAYSVLASKLFSGYTLGWEIANSSGGLRVSMRPGPYIDFTGASITLGKWYMGAFTYDGISCRMYVDGAFWSAGAISGATNLNSTATFQIGSRFGGNNFNGNIGMTMMYNRKLSDAEILQNFNATRGRYGI